MKKIILIIMLSIFVMCTTGCVTFYKEFKCAEDEKNIAYIEIYFKNDSYDTTNNNIPHNLRPIKKIDKENYSEIINDVKSLKFANTVIIIAANDPNFNLYGFIIKITYQSGKYQLIANTGTCYTYDSNDKSISVFHGYVEDDVWKELIVKYIGEETFNNYRLPN